jgi:hypothetical protein
MPPGDAVAHMYNAIQYFPLEGRVLDRIVRKRDNIGSHQAMLSRTRTMRRNTFSSEGLPAIRGNDVFRVIYLSHDATCHQFQRPIASQDLNLL